ncbi:cilia- and flagella-associated protein 99-like isoform X2 [Periplaneta americana]|uniref:cilia- and flagella-associated protein 99-like isoform X2 n=1 Tax=Periplaneta americana TaxID=6978 RepID=UPI0037E87167
MAEIPYFDESTKSDITLTICVLDNVIKILNSYEDRSIPYMDFLHTIVSRECKSESDKNFVHISTEVLMNIFKVEKLLKILADEYYTFTNRGNRTDRVIITVIVYLIVFKLREETIDEVKTALLHLQTLKRSYQLLQFFSQENIQERIMRAACMVFDLQYVKNNILQDDFMQCVKVLLHDIRQYYKENTCKKKLPLTVPMDVGVLKHPKKLPPPFESPTGDHIKLKPSELPRSTYEPPRDREKLQKCHEANKERAQRLFKWAQERAFNCAASPSDKTKTFQTTPGGLPTIEKGDAPSMLRTMYKRPTIKKEPVPVKMNTATLLREAAKFIRDEEIAIKRLEAMSSGTCNLEMYDNLLAELQQERERENLAAIEKKHLKGLISHEEALLSRQHLQQANKERRERFKREKEEWNQKLERLRAQEEQKIKELAEKCQNIRSGARDARKELQSQKQKIVQNVTEESKELLHKALKDREEELSRRIQLIKEIRALQAVRTFKVKEFDSTTSSGIGALCEMSLAELRERLFILQVDLKEELEERRMNIRKQREKHQRMMEETKEFIQLQRLFKKQRSLKPKKETEVPKDEEVEHLKQQLQEKREMRKKMVETSS